MKESDINLEKVKALYDSNIEEFGLDAKSVGWGTKEKQYLRFKKLLEVVENKDEPFSINELGCGYGELVKFMEEEQFAFSKYRGYDISEKMIHAAQQYISNTKTELLVQDKVSKAADYTVTSGIFNVMFDEEKSQWIDYIKRTLNQMFEHSRKGIAFNLLTKYVDFESPNLYYADPSDFFDFCKRELSKKVTLLHDYPLYEWTIIVRKQ